MNNIDKVLYTQLSNLVPVVLNDPQMGQLIMQVRSDLLEDSKPLRKFMEDILENLTKLNNLNTPIQRYQFIMRQIKYDESFTKLHPLMIEILEWVCQEQSLKTS